MERISSVKNTALLLRDYALRSLIAARGGACGETGYLLTLFRHETFRQGVVRIALNIEAPAQDEPL
jgi:hypothetical protein